jgi:ATP-dependent DNA helicase RecG
MFDKWYQPYEAVVGFERIRRIQIPTEAYREAVANALLHRRYDLNGAVQISMYEDRIDLLSPGGLPAGISETAYLYSQLSLPRNLKIAEVFHRLKIIERFGTGINRIRDEYTSFTSKPVFEVTNDFIRIVLPVIDYLKKPDEHDLKEQILVQIGNATRMNRAELEKVTGYQKSRLQEVLKQLVSEDKLEMLGQGPAVTYQIKQR